MSIVTSDAILLKKNELRETSLLLDFYTREVGKIRGVIKGIRMPQPQFGSLFEVFTLDKITFYENKNKDIFIISQCEMIDFFPELRKDLEKLAYASYITELIDQTMGLGEKNAEFFDIIIDSLRFLSQPVSAKRVTRIFEIKLLKTLGLMPQLTICVNCGGNISPNNVKFSIKSGGALCDKCVTIDAKSRPVLAGTINFINHVSLAPMEKVSRIKVSNQVGRELERLMSEFLNFHIGRRFRTMEFMKEVGVL